MTETTEPETTDATEEEEEELNAAQLNPTWQTRQVDTTGLGAPPYEMASAPPIFAQHRADTLQLAIDELSGDAPAGSSGYAVDPAKTQEETDAEIELLKTQQVQAQAIADGKQLDASGEVIEPEEGDGEAAPEAQQQSAESDTEGSATQHSLDAGTQASTSGARVKAADESAAASNKPTGVESS